MELDNGQYRITNADGDVLRKGIATATANDIFYIVDTAIFAVEQMKLVMPSYSGSFREYENRYGHGRVERVNKVRYYAYTEPQEAEEEGFAVVLRDIKVQIKIRRHAKYIRYGLVANTAYEGRIKRLRALFPRKCGRMIWRTSISLICLDTSMKP